MQNLGIDALKTAVSKVGGQSALARLLGLSQPTINGWLRTGAPPDRCAAIEAVSGVASEDLRPDKTWHRDAAGAVTGYTTPVTTPNQRAA